MQHPSYPPYPQYQPYPPQKEDLMQRRPWSSYGAKTCFFMAFVADFIGVALLGIAWLQLQGMNMLTVLGQLQAASQLLGPALISFFIGFLLIPLGLLFLAEHLS